MKATEKDGLPLSHRLANFLLTYRATPHATTNVAPCALFLNRPLRTRFDLLIPDPNRVVCGKQAEQVTHHDQHAKQRDFIVGQHIMAKNMRGDPKWVRGTIGRQLGPVSFEVELDNGLTWKRHIDHLRPLSPAAEPQPESQLRETPAAETVDQDAFVSAPPHPPDDEALVPVPPVEDDGNVNREPRYPARARQPPNRLMVTHS